MILVDLEGTLWQRELTKGGITALSTTGAALPAELDEVVQVLGRLADDRRNEVWVLSGLRVSGVLEALAERVPKVGIV